MWQPLEEWWKKTCNLKNVWSHPLAPFNHQEGTNTSIICFTTGINESFQKCEYWHFSFVPYAVHCQSSDFGEIVNVGEFFKNCFTQSEHGCNTFASIWDIHEQTEGLPIRELKDKEKRISWNAMLISTYQAKNTSDHRRIGKLFSETIRVR